MLWALASLSQKGYTDPDLTLHLILSGVIAESGMNPYAERYGAWPDVSFGLAQFSVAHHWAGTKENTPANIDYVKWVTFERPDIDLYYMGLRLLDNLHQARAARKIPGNGLSRVGGEIPLAALIIYNAGNLPKRDSDWWTTYADHVDRYREAMFMARQMLEQP